jgi:hypothetical protein
MAATEWRARNEVRKIKKRKTENRKYERKKNTMSSGQKLSPHSLHPGSEKSVRGDRTHSNNERLNEVKRFTVSNLISRREPVWFIKTISSSSFLFSFINSVLWPVPIQNEFLKVWILSLMIFGRISWTENWPIAMPLITADNISTKLTRTYNYAASGIQTHDP